MNHANVSPGENSRLLLVDDDERFLVSLRRGLSLRGFDVQSVSEPGGALPVLETGWPELLMLDVMMPGMDGISFCKLVRNTFDVPILMLTARDAVEDRVAGLNAGADDYLPKPFALDELVARVRALIRRTSGNSTEARVLRYADIAANPTKWIATRQGATLSLTSTEFKLLVALMEQPEKVFTRSELLDVIWGEGGGFESNVVDVHIANLRRKLEQDGAERIIQTVRRAGYKIQAT